jgi:Ku protein
VVVGRDEIVKGYEFAKDPYAMFTAEELEALEEVATHSIDVAEFVPLAAVEPVFLERTYDLAPDRGGAKPFALFVAALKETGRCAVGRWASHGRDQRVILRPIGHALALHRLHFAAERKPARRAHGKPSAQPQGFRSAAASCYKAAWIHSECTRSSGSSVSRAAPFCGWSPAASSPPRGGRAAPTAFPFRT